MYIIIDKLNCINRSYNWSGSHSGLFYGLLYLQSFKFKNGAKVTGNTLENFCYNCNSLRQVLLTDMFDLSGISTTTSNTSNMFSGCSSLRRFEIDLTNNKNLPITISGASLAYLNYVNGNTSNFKFNSLHVNPNGVRVEMSSIPTEFGDDSYNRLSPITEIIFNYYENQINFGGTFRRLKLLKNANENGTVIIANNFYVGNLQKLEGKFEISCNLDLRNCFNFESWDNLVNSLVKVSSKILTLGNVNYNKLSKAQRDTITSKGWAIV